jgi:rSAM/selenodomain-associated transferase 2
VNRISLIIPVLNEAEALKALLPYLREHAQTGALHEIIVVDGGSTDPSAAIAEAHGARVIRSQAGRAWQMNAGARQAQGDILYFLHADTFPPAGYDRLILQAMAPRPVAGCFRLAFDQPGYFLGFFAWFTRLNWPICRGGDQSLFLPARWFEELGGFNEAYRVYEDNELTGRLYRHFEFRVLPESVTTSARRYREVGMLRLQYHFAVIHLKKWLGSSPEALYRYYQKKIARGAGQRVS